MPSIYKYYYEILDLQTVGVLKAFAVDATGAATTRGQVMEEITKTAAHQPHVYAMMVKDRPELTVVHQVMHFTPPMGGEVQPWQNKVITWTGDVHGGQHSPNNHSRSSRA